jgi:hypothetical protein
MKTIEDNRIPESKRDRWLQETLDRIRNGLGTESQGRGTIYTRDMPGPRASRSRYIDYWVTKKKLQPIRKGIFAESDWNPIQQQLPACIAEVVLTEFLTWEDLFERVNLRRIAAFLGMDSSKISNSYEKVLRLGRESIEKAIAKAFVIRLQKSNPQSDSENPEGIEITPFSEGYLPGPLSSRRGRWAEEKMREASTWHYELARKHEKEALSRFYGDAL